MKEVLDKKNIKWYYVKVTDGERSEQCKINIIKKVLDKQEYRWYDIKVVAERKSSKQQNKLKKFLTNKKNCDKIIKLLAHKKRITKKIFDNWTIRQPWKF